MSYPPARFQEDTMNSFQQLSTLSKLTVYGLIAAAVGIVIQIASGIDIPTIPPGLFFALIPAALIAFGPWRWTPILGTVVGLFLFVGLFLSGGADRLVDPTPFGGLVGLWLMVVAELLIMVTGVMATIENYRSPAGPARTSQRQS